MIVLSLDLASTAGWCIDSKIYGTWDLSTKKDESMGMKLIRYQALLEKMYDQYKFKLIVYERAAGRHAYSIIHQSKLIAVTEKFCEEKGIDYKAYSAKEIKKFATGNGNASKQEMIKAAAKKYNYKGSDDNEADAIHMRELCRNELNL